MISDATYSTVIFYEASKFLVMDILVLCVPLSHISFFVISYSTAICYEAGKFQSPTHCFHVVLFSAMTSVVTYSTMTCNEAC